MYNRVLINVHIASKKARALLLAPGLQVFLHLCVRCGFDNHACMSYILESMKSLNRTWRLAGTTQFWNQGS